MSCHSHSGNVKGGVMLFLWLSFEEVWSSVSTFPHIHNRGIVMRSVSSFVFLLLYFLGELAASYWK